MRLKTRLTERLGIRHPVLLAPMGVIAGGRLAAAVSEAGGLGIIGGGYGDADWLEQRFAAAGSTRVGCGFITWSMAKSPQLLDQVLARQPAALMLSFGELEPHASRIKACGVPLWKLLIDLTPAQVVALLDLSYLEDALLPAEAVELLRRELPRRAEPLTCMGWMRRGGQPLRH